MKKWRMAAQEKYISGKYGNGKDFERDSSWKVKKIIPIMELLLKKYEFRKNISLLDVGGGRGEILFEISNYSNRLNF